MFSSVENSVEVCLKFKLLRQATLLLVFLSAASVLAASGGDHHGGGLDEKTIRTIMYQAINLGVILIGLVYFLRQPVREYFASKHQSYVQAAEKAQAARKQAEDEYQKTQTQLSKLEATTQESISRARAEAADLRNNLVAEAQSLSKRIHDETHAAAVLEIEKAKNALRQEMISEAIKVAQGQIQSAVSSEDHARLNKEFIKNIEAVQP